jgi:hypothetical protein
MPDVNFGIKKITLAPATADGSYPDFTADGVVIPMIVADSFNYDKEDDQKQDIFWEDFDDVGLVLPGQKGKRTIVFQTNDLSAEALAYLTGEGSVETGSGENKVTWRTESVGFVLPPQAMQVITRAVDIYPAKKIEYAKLEVEVKESGTLGKNGLPNLTLTCTKLANMDTSGVEISGRRITNA